MDLHSQTNWCGQEIREVSTGRPRTHNAAINGIMSGIVPTCSGSMNYVYAVRNGCVEANRRTHSPHEKVYSHTGDDSEFVWN